VNGEVWPVKVVEERERGCRMQGRRCSEGVASFLVSARTPVLVLGFDMGCTGS
jgi:hypothetical protein